MTCERVWNAIPCKAHERHCAGTRDAVGHTWQHTAERSASGTAALVGPVLSSSGARRAHSPSASAALTSKAMACDLKPRALSLCNASPACCCQLRADRALEGAPLLEAWWLPLRLQELSARRQGWPHSLRSGRTADNSTCLSRASRGSVLAAMSWKAVRWGPRSLILNIRIVAY